MTSPKVRVLVVDDSALVCELITDCLNSTSDIEVVGTAPDGLEALKMLHQVRPDIVTLDVEMPRLGGLETLDRMLARRPIPVIMVSSLTQVGATTAFDALARGAVDYVPKPQGLKSMTDDFAHELTRKIRLMAGADVERLLEIRKARKKRLKTSRPARPLPAAAEDLYLDDKCIAIGISTGGPPALSELFSGLHRPMPPIVVVQHMPPGFTTAFAWRLDSIADLSVKEAVSGDVLQPNHVFIAPGGKHLELYPSGQKAIIRIRDGETVSGHRPSVDVMMHTAARIYKDRCLGVVMTGMGRDGADGCKEIRDAGGYVLGQDEATSDVYGMNKVAWAEGGVDRQFRLGDAADEIRKAVQQRWANARAMAGGR